MMCMLYNTCYVIKYNTNYKTHMLCYITHVMLYNR